MSSQSDSGDALAEELEAALADAEDHSPDDGAPPPAKKPRLDDDELECQHPGYYGGVCIACGAPKPTTNGPSNVGFKYIHTALELTTDEADRLRSTAVQHALARRQLLLVLDLDHTLLNSARFADLTQPQGEMLQELEKELHIEHGGDRLLKRFDHMAMWTKLRPFVREFLHQVSQLFELYIYTMGDRDYAAEMAAFLDPKGQYFRGRVISKNDSTTSHAKQLDVVLGVDHMVLVIDDTDTVWPNNKANLMQIARYLFFPHDAVRYSGSAGRSYLERHSDESPDNGALQGCLATLRWVHARFFAAYDKGRDKSILPDVRPMLADARRRILKGVHIVFSSVIPLQSRDPTQEPFWKFAELLGAVVHKEVGPEVTHVVAKKAGTDKHATMHHHKGRMWSRRPEGDYPLKPVVVPAAATPPTDNGTEDHPAAEN